MSGAQATVDINPTLSLRPVRSQRSEGYISPHRPQAGLRLAVSARPMEMGVLDANAAGDVHGGTIMRALRRGCRAGSHEALTPAGSSPPDGPDGVSLSDPV